MKPRSELLQLADAVYMAMNSRDQAQIEQGLEGLRRLWRDGWRQGMDDAGPAVVAACGPCSGRGFTVEVTEGHACDGTEGDCALRCPVPIQTQVQCEYCGRPVSAILAARDKGPTADPLDSATPKCNDPP